MDGAVAQWKQWADRLGVAALSSPDEFTQAALAMSDETFAELAAFYERALRDDDLTAINAWLKGCAGAVPMTEDEKGIRHLVLLFAYLGGCWGRRPFNSKSISRAHLIPPTRDWSKLPPEFACLADAAELCGKFSFTFSDEGRERIRAEITEQEMAQLSQAAEHVRRIGYQNIKAWWKRVGTDVHVEASLMFNLMGVLDALRLPYY